MLSKLNKLDYTTIKSYPLINLLNFIGKVYKKVMADMLAKWREINHVLHEGQMGSRRERIIIEDMAKVFNRVQEARVDEILAGMLLKDVKGAFDHVSRKFLLQIMRSLDTDGDLM